MRVVNNYDGETPNGVVQYIGKTLSDLSDVESEDVLFNGYNCCIDKHQKEKFKDHRKKGLLALWSPCEFLDTTVISIK